MLRFDEKARENLEAADRLLPDDQGEREALSNAAASRAYYAAYLAVSNRAQRERLSFTDAGRNYYRHDTLPGEARSWGLLSDEQADDLIWLRDLRIKADYWEDLVSLEEASAALEVANELVSQMLDQMLEENGGA